MAPSPLTQATFYYMLPGWLSICICFSSHNTKAHVAHLSLLSTKAHDNLDGIHYVNSNGKGKKMLNFRVQQ